jgi:hypothetical protein
MKLLVWNQLLVMEEYGIISSIDELLVIEEYGRSIRYQYRRAASIGLKNYDGKGAKLLLWMASDTTESSISQLNLEF